MIYYFSSTGNSRFIAETLAEKLNCAAYSIQDISIPLPFDGDAVGIVFPVHAWGIPNPMLDFLKKLKGIKPSYAFGLCTCGEDAGKSLNILSKIFPLDSAWSISMPNNYIIAVEYGLDEEAEAEIKITEARAQLIKIAKHIQKGEKVWEVNEGKHAKLKSYLIHKGFLQMAKYSSKDFHSEGCTACGVCEKLCPTNNISYDADGKPVWGNKCILCLACLNRCPEKAIQYGEITKNRGRYTLESFLENHNC